MVCFWLCVSELVAAGGGCDFECVEYVCYMKLLESVIISAVALKLSLSFLAIA